MERTTRQRLAIRRALERVARPLSPHELRDEARREVAELGLATVYRAVRTLVADGTLAAVELPGEPARYELADATHHHHFRCRACDRVFGVDGCLAGIATLVPAGFELERHELTLYGRCQGCRGS